MKIIGIKDGFGKDVDVMMAPIGQTYSIVYRPNERETISYPIETIRGWLETLEGVGVTHIALDVLS